MKLNLGCGTDIRPGYINVDVIKNRGVDVVCDITQKLPFENNSIEEIVAQDVLEHLTREQLLPTLNEISRILKVSGQLFVRIPSVDAIFDRFADDQDTRNLFLYGNSYKTGIWGVHKAGYTSKEFIILCRLHNLEMVSETSVDTNFEFKLKKIISSVKPRKILFINQTLGIGGAETFNIGLFNWLKKQNIKIESHTTNNRFNKMLGDGHIIPVVLDIIGNWRGLIKAILLLPFGLWHYLKLLFLDFDVIYMSGFPEKIIVTPLAKLLNKPVVWVEFGPLESVFNKFFGLPMLLYRLVSWMPDIVIMPTQHTYKANSAVTHIPTAKIRIIPCAVEFVNCKLKIENLSVVCVSRLEKGKGQDLLIEAWPRVLEKFPDAKLKIIGEGDLKLMPCKNVEIVGYVKDAVSEIAKASVLVFPSVWPLEGFGLVMLEAMSQNVPVVAYDRGTAPEIIDDSCGILVNDLAEGIVKMLEHPTKGGVKRFNENFTFDIIGPKYLEVFKYAYSAHSTI
ncbi:MAG: glycosyltransferase [Candidatus Amesbacteria bacterium]|nr:glycosyltransferase [Candidatus Amesbacteria bacterium]